ncbi:MULTISPECIES: STAS domain-containing protein [Streptomyces]|uniref:STAS domain-containing protein n=1 Tax=Streptomyces TaxID=1883 RepID=UPI00067B0844|nr:MULTISPECIES: STAS domain-containing protein [Streptomyces]MYW78841.1 STAS domain-containing protein [Streptomyces sp. SID8369]MDW4915440.1 STAS domain-containing protein [Streptomyces californicus]QRV59482.1 STAS domain-containing protein [Streptomyces californicus]QSS95421.1 STAS domain-containing protein [Streptomyces sp. M54]SDE35614.1 anti-sigma B factor antagonist [Streptomyces sp. LaPpAH-199]
MSNERAHTHHTTCMRTSVITLSGEFDVDNEIDLHIEAQWALRAQEPRTLIDVSGVSFADSTVLNWVLRTLLAHRTAGKQFAVCGPLHPFLARIFDVTGVLPALTIYPSLSEALSDTT